MSTSGQWKSLLTYAVEQRVKLRLEHLEMMAAAYFAATNIDPREVVLVEDARMPGRTFYYYSTRDEIKTLENEQQEIEYIKCDAELDAEIMAHL